MHSVVVAKFVPWPPNSGDKRRTLGVVRALRAHGEVTVCAYAGQDEDVAGLEAEGVRVVAVPRGGPLPARLVDLALGLLRGQSLTSARFYSRALDAAVRDATARRADALVVEHVQLVPLARRSSAATTVLDMHNVESSLTDRYARSQRGVRRLVLAVEARLLRRLERRASASAGVVALASAGDADRLRDLVGSGARGADGRPVVDRLVVVPNAWDEPTPLPQATGPVVCFVALLSWAPNVDAAVWFAEQVWPLVRAERPDATLLLVGRNPAPAVRELAGPGLEVTGTVPDLTPSYARSALAVAPLRSGGGSRLKILEALAHARPVVSTTVGVEGLEDLVGRGVVVADEPAAMARELVDLLADPARRARLGEAGAAAVGDDHSWAAATRPLVQRISDDLGAQT
ncbi:glycosyltransferase [Aquipuribacter hungaricus]|uniref:Glycosyltransferase n=1 Tax=Aquipuribacter hungaricus TaxID=545624 RepID=A0ABV7WE25_9MICO